MSIIVLFLVSVLLTWAPVSLAQTTLHVGHNDHHESTPAETVAKDEAAEEEEDEWDVNEPRGPHSSVTFSTSEGTWMSVDVSPDGATLVFDHLGDLFTLPVSGGTAQRLTQGMAWDFQPRFSPDGTEILFTSDREGSDNIWILPVAGGDPKQLTKEDEKVTNCGAWSPDGQTVMTKRRLTDTSSLGTTELWMYHRTGGDGIQITKKDDIPEVSEPIFHPDGRFVYFSARPSRFGYNRNVHQGIYQIRRFDLQTGEVTPVTNRFGGAGNPAISPDGNTLAFITRDGLDTVLMLHDLVSGAERRLTDGLDPDLQEAFAWTGVYPAMDFTPDGRHIVVSAQGRLWKVNANTGAKATIPFTVAVEQTVQEALSFKPNVTSDTFNLNILRWIHESPRDQSIVFAALGRIYQADSDGTNPKVLLKNDDDSVFEYAPRLSADGKRLAYVTWSDTDKGHVWTANANGGGQRQITTVAGQYANPNWSADAKHLVYLKGSGATLRGNDLAEELWHEIYVVQADGKNRRYVASVGMRGSQARMPNPVFGPDGLRIYFMENGESNTVNFVSVNLDGVDKKTHAALKYGEEFALSPNGKWIAYKHLHDAYVAPMPLAGTNKLELGDSDGAVVVKALTKDVADWIAWADDETLTWAQGNSFYRQTLEKILAEPEEDEDEGDDDADGKGSEDDEDEAPDPNAPESVDVLVEVNRQRPTGTLVIDGARLITMNGDEVIENGVVVVKDNRIVQVGAKGSVSIPDGAEIVDASGMTAIPGLVDAHAHMGYGGLDILPQRDWRYYANLAYGVTATMDPSASTHLVFSQAEMVEAGVMKGPRIYSTGFILYGADIPGKAPTKSLDDAKRHVRRQKKLGAFAVKSYMQPKRIQRQWMLEAAREEKMLVFPEGGGNFQHNLGMIVDGHTGIEHSVPVAPLYDDVVQLWSNTKVGYTPTLLVSYGGLSGEHWFYQNDEPIWRNQKLLRFTPRADVESRSRRLNIHAYEGDWHHVNVAASCDKLVQAGVGVNMGAHGQRQGLGCHWELWALSHGGMNAHDVLRCGTLFPARYIGLGDELGSLEAGKLADIVLLAKNPLDDIRNTDTVRIVIKNGEMFDGDTMDQMYPVKAKRKPFLWELNQ